MDAPSVIQSGEFSVHEFLLKKRGVPMVSTPQIVIGFVYGKTK